MADEPSMMEQMFEQSIKNDKAKNALQQDLQFISKVTKQVTGASANHIHSIISDSLDTKQDPVKGLQLAFGDTPLARMHFYTRSTRTKLIDFVIKPAETGAWKAFVRTLADNNGGAISMAFHAHGQRIPWVISNHITGYNPKVEDELYGCITVHVRGNNMPVYITRLDIYMKEITS